MAVANWKFILTDIQGVVLGEVTNADSRQVVLPLSRLPTASFKIPSLHAMAGYFIDPTWDGLLKCYRNSQLVFNGPVLTGLDTGDDTGEFITVNAVSPMWRLGLRLIGTSSAGWALGTASVPFDLGFIAQSMLSYANSQGYTGITQGSTVASNNGSAGTYYFKDVLTALAEISSGLNSFEFECAPTEPTNVSQAFPQIALMNVAPIIGSAKPDVIFEYGTGLANADKYSIQIDRSNLLTKGWMQDPSVSDNSNNLVSTPAISSAALASRGLYEALVDNGGVQYTNLRQLLLDENVTVRQQARMVVNIEPSPNATPQPLVDYIVGDTVNAHIVRGGLMRFNGAARIWGITFNVDQNNNEVPVLQLIQ